MSDCSCGCGGGGGGACGGADVPGLAQPVGDPQQFRHSALTGRMKAAIGSTTVRGTTPLTGLTTRKNSAPDLTLIADARRTELGEPTGVAGQFPVEWKNLAMDPAGTTSGGTLDLDAVHPQAMAGKAALFAALSNWPAPQMARISAVEEGARMGFGLSAKVSRVTVSGG